MQVNFTNPRPRLAVRWTVALCLALIWLVAGAQVLHYHADPLGGASGHCPLCQVLHSATAVTHSVQIAFAAQAAAYLPVCPDSAKTSSSVSFALFSRPPPLA